MKLRRGVRTSVNLGYNLARESTDNLWGLGRGEGIHH
jgi:hypothetical protein